MRRRIVTFPSLHAFLSVVTGVHSHILKNESIAGMRIHFRTLLSATIPAVLSFMLIDAAVEHLYYRITGISLLSFYENLLNIHYGIRFHIFNFILFPTEMFLVIFFCAMLRPQFISSTKPLVITICFFLVFVGLFLGQMINTGIYQLQAAFIFGISTLIGFPVAVCIGASVYDRRNRSRDFNAEYAMDAEAGSQRLKI